MIESIRMECMLLFMLVIDIVVQPGCRSVEFRVPLPIESSDEMDRHWAEGFHFRSQVISDTNTSPSIIPRRGWSIENTERSSRSRMGGECKASIAGANVQCRGTPKSTAKKKGSCPPAAVFLNMLVIIRGQTQRILVLFKHLWLPHLAFLPIWQAADDIPALAWPLPPPQ